MNFSRLNILGNNANNSKKNERLEVYVTNNMRMKNQTKLNNLGVINPFNFKPSLIYRNLNVENVEEKRDNKFSNDIIPKNINFRYLNTSPLVKKFPDTIKKKPFVTQNKIAESRKEVVKIIQENISIKNFARLSFEPEINTFKINLPKRDATSLIKCIGSIYNISKTGISMRN